MMTRRTMTLSMDRVGVIVDDGRFMHDPVNPDFVRYLVPRLAVYAQEIAEKNPPPQPTAAAQEEDLTIRRTMTLTCTRTVDRAGVITVEVEHGFDPTNTEFLRYLAVLSTASNNTSRERIEGGGGGDAGTSITGTYVNNDVYRNTVDGGDLQQKMLAPPPVAVAVAEDGGIEAAPVPAPPSGTGTAVGIGTTHTNTINTNTTATEAALLLVANNNRMMRLQQFQFGGFTREEKAKRLVRLQAVARDATTEDEDYDEQHARALLQNKGFDPDDFTKSQYNRGGTTPLLHFCALGNFKMCRFLVSRGADCRGLDEDGRSPLFRAAANGHLEIVTWLYYDGGAHEDIRKRSWNGFSPLSIALKYNNFDVVSWLTRNGALESSRDGVKSGVIDDMIMRDELRPNFYWRDDYRLPILSWVQGAVTTNDNFQLALTGTNVSATSSSFCSHPINPHATRSKKRMKVSPSPSPSPLVEDALKLVAEYVGNPTAHELRIFRQLLDLLPAFIEDVPFVKEEYPW